MRTKYNNVYVNPDEREMRDGRYRRIYYNVAFDLDSVLNQMGDPLGKYIADHYGVSEGAVHGWDHYDEHRTFHFELPDVPHREISELVHKYIQEESPSLLPTPYMKEVLTYIHEITDQDILIITARPRSAVDVTYNWLMENLYPVPFTVYIMDNMPKSVPLAMHGVNHFVDDRHKTIKDLRDRNVIHNPILYRRFWNQGRARLSGVTEINDLRDMIPLMNLTKGYAPMEWPSSVPYPNRLGESIYA